MNFIMDLIQLAKTFFEVVLAVPIYGPLLLLGTIALFIVKAIRHR